MRTEITNQSGNRLPQNVKVTQQGTLPRQQQSLPPLPIPSSPIGQPLYPAQTPLIQALDWLLASPSIPLVLRKQFFILWENIIFGNYNEKDRLFLMSKFREWAILLCWYIPEQKWGNLLIYQEAGQAGVRLEMDLNILLNMLEQLYFVNLTRGKDGFTVKEMTTIRSFNRTELVGGQSMQQPLRLF